MVVVAAGRSTLTATADISDANGNPVSGDPVAITSTGNQNIGPVIAGSTPGSYQAAITSTTTVGSSTITATDSAPDPVVSGEATLAQDPVPPPGSVGVVIDNGDYATNTPDVEIDPVWPAGATQIVISNDGGFGHTGNATTFSLAAQLPWTLQQTGADRLPKTVYIRFISPDASIYAIPYVTLTDTIILDELAPTVQSATLLRTSPAHVATLARVRHPGHRYRIKIKAKDTIVGICAVEASRKRAHGTIVHLKNCDHKGILRLARTVAVTTRHPPRYLRVLNSAGTWSRWRKLAR